MNMDPFPSDALLDSWKEGIEHFNSRRFWEAHEAWERGWLKLPRVQKLHVQTLIQTAGVFDLVKRGRPQAALRLAKLALQKTGISEGELGFPRIHIPALAKVLSEILKIPENGLFSEIAKIRLKAELLLSPGS
jgi:hypothetical protein